MKMKHIMVFVAVMAFTTVLAEAKGGGDRDCTRAKKCNQECAQDCTKEQKQDCSKECTKGCDKKQARDGSCGK
jgi:hypothetical protein